MWICMECETVTPDDDGACENCGSWDFEKLSRQEAEMLSTMAMQDREEEERRLAKLSWKERMKEVIK